MERDTVLVGSSSLFMRTMLRQILESINIRVVVVKDGKELVDSQTKVKPDVTLLDLPIESPIAGMDPIEIIRLVKYHNPSTVVIALVPEQMDKPDVIVEAVEAGMQGYTKKPILVEELKARIRRTLEESRPRYELPLTLYPVISITTD